MGPDALAFGWTMTVVGLGIVFSVLTAIAVMVWTLGRLDDRWRRREAEAAATATEREQTIDDTTLVLICAAVATMLVGRNRIRSVRRLLPPDSPSSPWSAQGRAVLMGSHVPPKRK